MRFFIAFFISLLLYLLLIWLYITQFSKVVVLPKKMNNHIIKINIRNIPDPKPIAEVKPIVKKVVLKKPIKKKVVKKKVVKKKVVKKKVVKKKVVKKKVVKKKPVVKKKVPIKTKLKPKVARKTVVKSKAKVKVTKKSVKKKDENIVYIPEPFIVKSSEQKAANADDLASFLGAAAPSRSSSRTKSYPNKKIQKLYGSTFHSFTPTQKKFIENNLDDIQRITQNTLTRRGYPEGAGHTGQEGTNVVSFNLHPNGNISALRLKTRIGYRALDDNTLELIKTAYKDYPYPNTTTKIVFYVTYSIYGY